MIPRLLILIGLVLAGFSALFYLVTRVHRFRFSLALARGRHGWSWVISVLAVLLPSAAIWLAWGYMNAIICLLHLALFWLLSDALFALLKRLHGKPWRRYYAGLTALLLTAAYLSAGWVQAHHVWQTDYVIRTDKPVGTLRIALLADSHMGTTFHADGFARELDRIAAQKPDLLVIAGDFVDEDTEKDDMLAACRALGQLDMPVYYVFGNHDKGLYDSKCTRGFTGDDLAAELTENGVHVLEDEIVPIGDAFWLIGRQDASEELGLGGGRASMAELTRGRDTARYSIVLDHQPHDYDAEAASGVDLVLSGHKIHGPKGIGALAMSDRARPLCIAFGGGQENGLRSGTENVPGIAGLGQAVRAFARLDDPASDMMELKMRLRDGILQAVPDAKVNGPTGGAPHILNVTFPVKGEVLLHALEGAGILCSTGSACASHKKSASHVLTAMGVPDKEIDGALRFSLCPMNTPEEIDETVAQIRKSVEMLRAFKRR